MSSRKRYETADGLRNGDVVLDAVNRRLLVLLTENARVSTSELARKVDMSAPAVRERLARLEQAGVIRGYHVDIDPAAIGLPVAAWVRVRPGPGHCPGSPSWPVAPRRSASVIG